MKYRFIEAAGAKYPVSFGMNAIAKFLKATGLKVQDLEGKNISETLDLNNTIILLFCGLTDGFRKAKKAGEVKGKCPFATYEDVGDLIDDDKESINRILEAFSEDMPEDEEAEGGNGQAQEIEQAA